MPEDDNHEEYEIIPVSPLRRLEKRMEDIESNKERYSSQEFLKEIVDIIKMNQSVVQDIVKANDSLKTEIAKLPPKIDALLNNINELVSYIKAAATEEIVMSGSGMGGASEAMVARLNDIAEGNKKIVELTQTMVSALEEVDRRLKRTQVSLPPMRRPPMNLPPMRKPNQ